MILQVQILSKTSRLRKASADHFMTEMIKIELLHRDIFNSLVPLAYTICSASLRWNWINLSIKSPIENKWIQIECEGRDWHCNLYTLCEYIFIFVCFAPRCRPYLRCPPGLQVLPGGRTMESLSPKNGNNFPIFSNLLSIGWKANKRSCRWGGEVIGKSSHESLREVKPTVSTDRKQSLKVVVQEPCLLHPSSPQGLLSLLAIWPPPE